MFSPVPEPLLGSGFATLLATASVVELVCPVPSFVVGPISSLEQACHCDELELPFTIDLSACLPTSLFVFLTIARIDKRRRR